MPRVDTSAAVLDAAEMLFAQNGLSAVSDRRIAEVAGNSNHSAVRYYFGGREGLLEALVRRHEVAVVEQRRALQAESEDLVGDLRAMVLPQVDVLAALGVPSWRARFLAAAYADPLALQVIRSLEHDPVTGVSVFEAVRARLAWLDPAVLEGRARLMGHMLVSTCAGLEEREAAGEPVRWPEVAWFLCDAIAGMLQGPVTAPPRARAEA